MYYITVIHADHRTLWQIMTEPSNRGYSKILMNTLGNKLTYNFDGNKTINSFTMQIPLNYTCD